MLQATKLLFIILLFLSCESMQSIETQPSSELKFRREMPIKVNGYNGIGMLTVPVSSTYKIEIEVSNKTKIIKVHTCHREISIERKASGWSNKKQTILLPPVSIMENSGYCPIEIGAFDIKGRHSWGLIEIINEDLPADIICNGEERNHVGVSVCQSKSGLIQRIEFKNDVTYSAPKRCAKLRRIGNSFEYKTTVGDCIYLFGYEGKFHRLTSYGYETILFGNIKPSNQ